MGEFVRSCENCRGRNLCMTSEIFQNEVRRMEDLQKVGKKFQEKRDELFTIIPHLCGCWIQSRS